MKMFQTFQNNCKILGLDSSEHSFNRKMFIALLILLSCITFCLLYLPESNSFEELTECVYMTSAVITIVVCYESSLFQMEKLFKYINDCENFVNERLEYDALKSLYIETNRLIEFCSKIIYLVVSEITPISFVLPKFLFSFFIYLTKHLENDAFQLPFPMWFPFDTKNPIGYIVATLLQYVIVIYVFSVLSNLLALGIGAFLFAVSAIEDIIRSIKSIEKGVKSEKHKSITFNRFCDLIQLHSTVKQLFLDFSDLFKPLFMAIFTWSLVVICTTMLMFQTEISHGDYFTVIFFATIVEATYAFGVVFIVCELSERASAGFEEIDRSLGEIDWYLLPDSIKRILPTIILNLHQPVVLKCFGSILCSREAFKKVVNSGFSYFMILRQFSTKL